MIEKTHGRLGKFLTIALLLLILFQVLMCLYSVYGILDVAVSLKYLEDPAPIGTTWAESKAVELNNYLFTFLFLLGYGIVSNSILLPILKRTSCFGKRGTDILFYAALVFYALSAIIAIWLAVLWFL